MKKGLKGLFTASLAVLALGGLVACGGEEEKPTPTPTPTPVEPTPTPVVGKNFEFVGGGMLNTIQFDEEGNPIIEDVMDPNTHKPVVGPDGNVIKAPKQKAEKYTAKIAGKEGDLNFKLELASTESAAKKSFKGTYEFFDGIGYTFTFAGSNEVVRSVYNKDAKTHNIVYNAGLGDLGKGGEVKLSVKDETFQISEEMLFVTAANFGFAYNNPEGIMTDDGPQKGIGFGMQFFPNGVVQFKNNHLSKLNQEGTYTYENDTFTVTVKDFDGKTVTASSTNVNGVYTIPLKFNLNGTELAVNLAWNSNYYGGHGLSVVTYPMGAEFKTTLTFNNDGTCLLDGEPLNPLKAALAGMNLFTMFDRTGTWTYDATTKQYTITYDDLDMAGNKADTHTYTSTFDEATGLFKMEFTIGTAHGFLTGKDFGKDFTAKHTA